MAGPPRGGGRALPAVHRAAPDRGGPHLPRLGAQPPGAARGRDRRVQDRDRGGPGLRQPLQRHRRLPDRARPRGGGGGLARAREAGAPATSRATIRTSTSRASTSSSTRSARPSASSRAPRHRAALRDGPQGAAPAPRPAQLTALPLPFYDNPPALRPTPAPAACSPSTPARATSRSVPGATASLTATEEPFRPFLLLADPDLLKGFKGDVEVTPLDGERRLPLARRVPRPGPQALRARDHCLARLRQERGSARRPVPLPRRPRRTSSCCDPGKTSFLGMAFGDLRRMALDIEVTTAPGFEFPNAARESDRIIAIAIADSTGLHRPCCPGAELSEAELLAECSRIIRERDPDVLEGHNIFRFDLEYLEARARRHRVPLAWGRDGSALRGHPSRMQVAERDHRLPALRGRPAATSWTPGSSPSSTTWARATSSPTASRTSRATSASRRPTAPTCRPRTSRASSWRTPRGSWPTRATTCSRRSALSAHPVAALLRAGPGPALRLPDRPCCAATRPRSTRC